MEEKEGYLSMEAQVRIFKQTIAYWNAMLEEEKTKNG